MKITPTDITDVLVLEPSLHTDARGWFTESFRRSVLEEATGRPIDFVQENESYSRHGVLRGLHFQAPPHAQSKLVRVVAGCVLDVVVDLRTGSPTYGRHVAVELSSENRRQLFIPQGFAHGFVVLSGSARLLYKVDAYYAPDVEGGLIFDDPDLAIDWRLPPERLILSEKDRLWPRLQKLNSPFHFGVDA